LDTIQLHLDIDTDIPPTGSVEHHPARDMDHDSDIMVPVDIAITRRQFLSFDFFGDRT